MNFPVRSILIGLLPGKYRDEIIGDLIEESASSRAFNRELTIAVVRLLPMHFQQSEDHPMKHARWIAAAAIVILGFLQAWDSGILGAPAWIAAMVVFALAIGIAGLFTQNEPIRLGIAAVVFVLLFVARIVSPVRLPELTLVGLPIFFLLVLGPRFMGLAKAKGPPRGPGTAA